MSEPPTQVLGKEDMRWGMHIFRHGSPDTETKEYEWLGYNEDDAKMIAAYTLNNMEYTVTAIARAMKVSRKTIRRWIKLIEER